MFSYVLRCQAYRATVQISEDSTKSPCGKCKLHLLGNDLDICMMILVFILQILQVTCFAKHNTREESSTVEHRLQQFATGLATAVMASSVILSTGGHLNYKIEANAECCTI